MNDYDHLFIFDMNEKDAAASTVFSSYEEYKKLKKNVKSPEEWLASIG
jgi:hypothetical protein